MPPPQDLDPFLWDVENVVTALCATPCRWAKDPGDLADRLRAEEIDGRTLLSFEQTCSRHELMDCLGIRLARHKASLTEELVDLRAASRLYREWLVNFRRKISLEPLDDQAPTASTARAKPNHTDAPNNPREKEANEARPFLLDNQPRVEANSDGTAAAPPRNPLTAASKIERRDTPAAAVKNSNHNLPAPTDSEPPQKRRRLQPVNLSKEPSTSVFPWENQPAWAYIGDGELSTDMVISPYRLMSSQLRDHGNGGFSLLGPVQIPRGRRTAVYHILKRYFRRNSRKEARLGNGEMDIASSPFSEADDEILELSDLPSEFDEQTLREIEEEEREIQENQKPEKFLSQTRVQEILDDVVEGITANWRERKLQQCERRAHGIWTAATRHGSRAEEIYMAQAHAKHVHQRIRNFSTEILGLKWHTDDEVRSQAQILEPSVKDKANTLWLISVLESRVAPPKLPPLPRREASNSRKRPHDPELLMSSDEEEGDAFVVPDGQEETTVALGSLDRNHRAVVEMPPSPPVKREPFAHYDQVESPTRGTAQEVEVPIIDLTMQEEDDNEDGEAVQRKKRSKDHEPLSLDLPALETFESMQQICSADRDHWSSRNDRWRLVIFMLGKLSFTRRSRIFKTVKEHSSQEVWHSVVVTFTSTPPKDMSVLEQSEDETLRCDISRMFLSFVRCKIRAEQRMVPPSKRTIKKILDSRDIWFEPFCSFTAAVESLFPHESQIFYTQSHDADLEGDYEEADLDDPEGEQKSRSRRAVPKEIIRSKDGVDLRAREKTRAADQEARRQKLRAALASSDIVSRDKSRLIINETKEDDQALLYINEDIGGRIKDHQVEGVRFMWNQIILDRESRQGCLLAHTMGLGKTMQVITFLVAIAEAAGSSDPSLRDQVPDDLRKSQTLILCPPTLVANWMDELLQWSPPGVLGPLTHLDAISQANERLDIVQQWGKTGGVLVIGYNMFMRVTDDEEKAAEILLEKPGIVVADEAHMMKNPAGKLNRLCTRFKTTRRIALTGSPLANDVEEYYTTISWVAPQFLGPLQEFRAVYARVIQTGLWSDSSASERRAALKMLRVLKDTVSPKVNRATIACLAHDLPPKVEFVISVPPTPLQRAVYKLYVDGVGEHKLAQSQIFSNVGDLTLICGHPSCFHKKLLEVKKNPTNHRTFPYGIISAALKEYDGVNITDPSLSRKVEHLVKILDEARAMGDKVLVFSQSLYILDYLETLLKNQKRVVCRLDGATRVAQRQDDIRHFNTGRQEVYLISTKAGGVGLNIQGANRVVIFDSGWNPVNDQQAVGRAYRLGQTKSVFVYYFHVAGSVEDSMHSKTVFKTQLASRVVDKKNPIAWGSRNASLLSDIKNFPRQDLSGFVGKDGILDNLIARNQGSDGGITKIVSTDTFEEEDVSTNLTPEENREADNMVQCNILRRTDPEEYERRRMLGQVPLQMLSQQPAPSSSEPPSFGNQRPSWLPSSQPPLNHQSSDQAGNRPRAIWPPPTPTWASTPSTSMTSAASTPQYHRAGSTASSQTGDSYLHSSASTPHGNGAPGLKYADTAKVPVLRRPSPTHCVVGDPSILNSALTGDQSPNKPSQPSNIPAAPLPLTGANTFFGQKGAWPLQPPPQAPPRTPSVTKTPPHKGGGLFSQPASPEKRRFETKALEAASKVENLGEIITDRVETLAQSVTDEVDQALKKKSMGFLVDNQQWRLLVEMQDSPRFLLAVLSGFLSPQYLANADKAELLRRIDTLNNLSEVDFRTQLKTRKGPDPDNLDNMDRSRQRAEGKSGVREDDAKVMEEASEMRKQRRPARLPSWAVQNLSTPTSASAPVADRAGPQNGT